MVELVGHALVDGTVGLDVDNVPGLVRLQVRREGNGALLPEVAGEHVAGAGPETKRVGHLCSCLLGVIYSNTFKMEY